MPFSDYTKIHIGSGTSLSITVPPYKYTHNSNMPEDAPADTGAFLISSF
jgi:hypothetical protein